MAQSAGIGNFVFVRHRWRDETESMSVDESARRPFSFNRWHMAGHTLAACAAVFVVRVLFYSRSTWTVR